MRGDPVESEPAAPPCRIRVRTETYLLLGVERADVAESLDSPVVQSLTGRTLLTLGLRELGVFREWPVYRYGKFGKPYLANYDGVFFNIAHCVRAVVCLLSKKEMAVDVESIRPLDRELMEYVLNEKERADVLASVGPERRFAQYWTRKESVLKCLGTGIDERLMGLLDRVDAQTDSFDGPDYTISVCMAAEERGS